jgi:uncharacterized protein YoxC
MLVLSISVSFPTQGDDDVRKEDPVLTALKDLIDALKEVKEAHDKIFEISDAFKANLDRIKDGEAPEALPAQTELGDKWHQRLVEVQKKLDDLDLATLVPAHSVTLPNLPELSDRDLAKRSTAFARAVEFFEAERQALSQAGANSASLKENVKTSEAVRKAVAVAEEQARELLSRAPILFAGAAGEAWFDIWAIIQPDLNGIAGKFRSLHADVLREIEKRAIADERGIANFQLLLKGHLELVEGEARRIQVDQEKLEVAVKIHEREKELLKTAVDRLAEAEARVDEAKKVVAQVKAQ